MALDTTFSTAISQAVFTRFTAVQIALPSALGGNINLLDGAGFVTFSHNGVATKFDGEHPVYGTLAGPPDISTQTANSSPRVDLILMPPTSSALGNISLPSAQGSRVYVYEGALNPQTGLVIGAPALLWSGRLDTTEINAGPDQRSVRLDTCGALERFFEPRRSSALNETWHKWMFGQTTSLLTANISAAQPTPWGREGVRKITAMSSGISNGPNIVIPGGGGWHGGWHGGYTIMTM